MMQSGKVASGWKYYLPGSGETIEDATEIGVWSWREVFDAKDAAALAAADEWDNRDGWEGGMGCGPDIMVVSPGGEETCWSTNREAEVTHYVTAAAHGEAVE